MSDIDELEALAKGATQGRVEPRFSKAMPADCLDYGIVNLDTGKEICRVWERNDVEFLSAANPAAILKLIGDIRTLQAERDAAYNRGIEDAAKVAKAHGDYSTQIGDEPLPHVATQNFTAWKIRDAIRARRNADPTQGGGDYYDLQRLSKR